MTETPDAYDAAVSGLDEFGTTLASALSSSLDKTTAIVHAIPWRVKSRDSAARKLLAKAKPENEYGALHDLLGMRVICLFENDLEQVGRVIESLLDVNAKESSDKRDRYEMNQFGYRSRHYVGQLSAQRISLPEYQKYSGMTVEIQVRSILQHAWAEVEHDLGYKPSRPLADKLRRRFSQLAAVMELADEQFSDLRATVELVEGPEAQRSAVSSESGELTVAELSAFIKRNTTVARLDAALATILSTSVLPPGKDYRSFLAYLLDLCLSTGWHSTEQLEAVVEGATDSAYQWGESLTAEEQLAIKSAGRGLRPGFSLIVAATRLGKLADDDGRSSI